MLKLLPLDLHCLNIWNKVFKNGPNEICGIQPLKTILQILVGPFLNTLSHLSLYHRIRTCQNGLYNF